MAESAIGVIMEHSGSPLLKDQVRVVNSDNIMDFDY